VTGALKPAALSAIVLGTFQRWILLTARLRSQRRQSAIHRAPGALSILISGVVVQNGGRIGFKPSAGANRFRAPTIVANALAPCTRVEGGARRKGVVCTPGLLRGRRGGDHKLHGHHFGGPAGACAGGFGRRQRVGAYWSRHCTAPSPHALTCSHCR